MKDYHRFGIFSRVSCRVALKIRKSSKSELVFSRLLVSSTGRFGRKFPAVTKVYVNSNDRTSGCFLQKEAILTGFRGDNAPPGPHAAAASIRGIAHPFHIAQLQHFCVKRQKSDAPEKSRRRAMSAEIAAVPHGRGRRPDGPAATARLSQTSGGFAHPVGNAVPGVPRSSTEPKRPVGRIRIYPVGRAGPFHLSKAPSPIPSPSGGGCRPQGRPERENAAEPRCKNDHSRGEYANDFTVCKRSRSPSSVIRLAGDRRMPPSPAGGRKGRLRIRRTWELVFGAAARNAVPGVPYRACAIRRTWELAFGAAAGASGRRPLQ